MALTSVKNILTIPSGGQPPGNPELDKQFEGFKFDKNVKRDYLDLPGDMTNFEYTGINMMPIGHRLGAQLNLQNPVSSRLPEFMAVPRAGIQLLESMFLGNVPQNRLAINAYDKMYRGEEPTPEEREALKGAGRENVMNVVGAVSPLEQQSITEQRARVVTPYAKERGERLSKQVPLRGTGAAQARDITQPKTVGDLQRAAQDPDLTLYENAINKGDVSTAEELMKKHPNDVRFQIHRNIGSLKLKLEEVLRNQEGSLGLGANVGFEKVSPGNYRRTIKVVDTYDPSSLSRAAKNSFINNPGDAFDKADRLKGEALSIREAHTGLGNNGRYLVDRIVFGKNDADEVILKDGRHLLEAYRQEGLPVPKDKVKFEKGISFIKLQE